MARLLIGSSNVYKFYKPNIFKQYKDYSVVKCCNIETFDTHLANLEASQTEIVISVLENFLEKAGGAEDPEERSEDVAGTTKEFLKMIEEAAVKNPGTKFVLVEPILRPKLDWFDDEIGKIKKLQKDEIKRMKVINVFSVDVISRVSQQFENDGVHLTRASGGAFIEGILGAAETVFQASFVNLGDEEEEPDHVPKKKLTVEERVDKLEGEVEERRWNDNLLFARTREELDTATNKTKEDRIIITGLTSSSPPPQDKVQKSQWIRKIVIDILKKVKPDFDGKIGFVNQGKSNGREIPMVEVKMDSVEAASNIRKAFAEKRKEGDGTTLGRLYIANSVTLSTRVRIEVMKAIAKKLTTKLQSAHVAAFSSRPILHVKSTKVGDDQNPKAFTFTDSVIRYGSVVVQDDLSEAYKKAGTAFRGQIEQHFVVLNEGQSYQQQPRPQPTVGRGGNRKRRRDDEEAGTSSGKGAKTRKT
jgi:hypothetical protein